MKTFYTWVIQHRKDDNPRGDLARDMLRDPRAERRTLDGWPEAAPNIKWLVVETMHAYRLYLIRASKYHLKTIKALARKASDISDMLRTCDQCGDLSQTPLCEWCTPDEDEEI